MNSIAENRPTKKQRQMLSFIDNFISGHGYGPSYREIMRGLGYSSVSTVATHIDGLVAKGLLAKRDNSARSLEVVGTSKEFASSKIKPAEEKWLVNQVNKKFEHAEAAGKDANTDELYVLIGALTILGLDGAALSFTERLSQIRKVTGT